MSLKFWHTAADWGHRSKEFHRLLGRRCWDGNLYGRPLEDQRLESESYEEHFFEVKVHLQRIETGSLYQLEDSTKPLHALPRIQLSHQCRYKLSVYHSTPIMSCRCCPPFSSSATLIGRVIHTVSQHSLECLTSHVFNCGVSTGARFVCCVRTTKLRIYPGRHIDVRS